MRAIDGGVVSDSGYGRYRAPLSHATEQIFWHGSKKSKPQPLTLWLEPIITIGVLARLHFDLGWPTRCLGMQSEKGEFDFFARTASVTGAFYVAGEVKKSDHELTELLEYLKEFCAGRPAPTSNSKARNAWNKFQGMRRMHAAYFWAVGPARFERVFKIEHVAGESVVMSECTVASLRYGTRGLH